MYSSTLLFCWEYGGGIGHISSLEAVAAQLSGLDLKCILVNPGPLKASTKTDSFDEIIEFPHAQDLERDIPDKTEGIVSYNSVIAAFGFMDAKFVFARLKLWQRLFEAYKVDMVIGDYAPMAILAARQMRIPTMAMGNGYTLPPTNIGSFPKFVNQPEPVRDQEILQPTNQALRLAKLPEISSVPEIFSADIHACFTNRLFDPFRKVREPEAIGAFLRAVPETISDNSDSRVFVYLTDCRQFVIDLVLEALLEARYPADVYSYHLSGKRVAHIENSNIRILDNPLPRDDIYKNYSLVIHLGGHHLMMEMLEAGMPQLLLPVDLEKILHAQGMANFNYAHQLRLDKPKPLEVLVRKIHEAMNDQAMKTSLGQYRTKMRVKDSNAGLESVRKSIEHLLQKRDSG